MVGAIKGSTKKEPFVAGKPSTFMMDWIAKRWVGPYGFLEHVSRYGCLSSRFSFEFIWCTILTRIFTTRADSYCGMSSRFSVALFQGSYSGLLTFVFEEDTTSSKTLFEC